ncbi:response regulator transcription factor [Ancylobacter lacus]|uniref:response regulator transcription factor n=1 Tax=Ancylobacter lacus TaxID=2579970 RepID=UPI001BCC6B5D|nr:response regulator [Ancylobacter lacus]MBS7539159.1 response regulator [Ancylobacter lacus]
MTFQVLIVDDSKLARMAIAKAMNNLQPGWTRVEAANADDALALARSQTFDIALLDYNMPGRDGLQLAGELRDLSPGIALALISANHQREVVSQAHEVGAIFLSKPLTQEALGQFLSEVQQSKRSM